MNIEVYIRADDALMQSLDRIEGLLLRITRQLRTVQQNQEIAMADLTDLQTEVTQNTDVVASAVSLLNGLSQQLKDALAANDPAAVQALVDQLDANTATLADAVAANTPAAPGAPPAAPTQLPA